MLAIDVKERPGVAFRSRRVEPGLRILIVDDHTLVREGLKRVLAEEFHRVSFGEAGNAAEGIGMALGRCWDLVILALPLPGRSGLEAMKAIKAQRPELPVLMLSTYPEHQYAARAFRAGASGYLADSSAPVEMVRAVRKTLEGERYVSETLAQHLAAELSAAREGPPHEALSDREMQVLLLIGAGRTVKEAAVDLSLSGNTVSTYRSRILGKMSMDTSAELVRYVWENRLLP